MVHVALQLHVWVICFVSVHGMHKLWTLHWHTLIWDLHAGATEMWDCMLQLTLPWQGHALLLKSVEVLCISWHAVLLVLPQACGLVLQLLLGMLLKMA